MYIYIYIYCDYIMFIWLASLVLRLFVCPCVRLWIDLFVCLLASFSRFHNCLFAYRIPVCLFACLNSCLLVCSVCWLFCYAPFSIFGCSFMHSLADLLVCACFLFFLFCGACVFDCSFACVCLVACLAVCLFVCLFVRLFVGDTRLDHIFAVSRLNFLFCCGGQHGCAGHLHYRGQRCLLLK